MPANDLTALPASGYLCLTCLKQVDVVLMGWIGTKVLLNDGCLHGAVQDWGDNLASHLIEAHVLLVAPKVPATMS